MPQFSEMKFKVDGFANVVGAIKQAGGKPTGTHSSRHYYANQPGNSVLKLVVSGGESAIHHLQEHDGTYRMVEQIPVSGAAAGLKWLADNGTSMIEEVQMTHTDFELDGGVVGLYLINDELNSVILDFPPQRHDEVAAWLGLAGAERITIPYNAYLRHAGRLAARPIDVMLANAGG